MLKDIGVSEMKVVELDEDKDGDNVQVSELSSLVQVQLI